MTELEYLIKHKKEITKEALAGNGIAKVNGEITICNETECCECDFSARKNNWVDCDEAIGKWLDEEHIERPLPCPFCGSEIVHVYVGTKAKKYVECDNCYAKSGRFGTDEEALSAWNRRV